MATMYVETSAGESASLKAYGYRASKDKDGNEWPARLIIGFGRGGVSADVGFVGVADARAFAAMILEVADAAEGAEE